MSEKEDCSLRGVRQSNPALAAKIVEAATEATGLSAYEVYKKLDRKMLTEIVVNQILQQARERKQKDSFEYLSREVEGLGLIEAGIIAKIEVSKGEMDNLEANVARFKAKLEELASLKAYVQPEHYNKAHKSLQELIADAEAELNGSKPQKIMELESQLANVRKELAEKRELLEKVSADSGSLSSKVPTMDADGLAEKKVEPRSDEGLRPESADTAAHPDEVADIKKAKVQRHNTNLSQVVAAQ